MTELPVVSQTGATQTDRKTYEVTGDLTPEADGTYEDAGEYNKECSYQRTPNGWFLWWTALHNWIITTERGLLGPNYWKKAAGGIEGEYLPQGTASGIATVTKI